MCSVHLHYRGIGDSARGDCVGDGGAGGSLRGSGAGGGGCRRGRAGGRYSDRDRTHNSGRPEDVAGTHCGVSAPDIELSELLAAEGEFR
jgi:hypothetical protein